MDRGGEQESDYRTSVWNGYRLAVTTWKPPTSPKYVAHNYGTLLVLQCALIVREATTGLSFTFA